MYFGHCNVDGASKRGRHETRQESEGAGCRLQVASSRSQRHADTDTVNCMVAGANADYGVRQRKTRGRRGHWDSRRGSLRGNRRFSFRSSKGYPYRAQNLGSWKSLRHAPKRDWLAVACSVKTFWNSSPVGSSLVEIQAGTS
jgi:hypothetical protein